MYPARILEGIFGLPQFGIKAQAVGKKRPLEHFKVENLPEIFNDAALGNDVCPNFNFLYGKRGIGLGIGCPEKKGEE
jgi:hypothetical protein